MGNNSVVKLEGFFFFPLYPTSLEKGILMGKKCRLLNSAHSCSGHKLQMFLGKELEQALPHYGSQLEGGTFWGNVQQRTPGNCLF